jgi:hypothetical protein
MFQMKYLREGDHLARCLKQIKQNQVHVIWGAAKVTATYGGSDFGHDPVQESFATSRHIKIEIKMIRI